MKFVISRTSNLWNDGKPCNEAIEETFSCKDKHGEVYKRKRWVIQINSLDELLKLKEKCNHDLVICKNIFDDSYEIEIYDDFRE